MARTAVERVHILNNRSSSESGRRRVAVSGSPSPPAGYDGAVSATAVGGVGVVPISAQSMLHCSHLSTSIVSLTALEVLRNLLTPPGWPWPFSPEPGCFAFFGPARRRGRLDPDHAAAGTCRGAICERRSPCGDPQAPARDASARCGFRHERRLLPRALVSLLLDRGANGPLSNLISSSRCALLALPALILSVALPLLSVAGDEDESRLRHALQSMTEASLLIAALLVVGIAIPAEPGNPSHRGDQYEGAAAVLRSSRSR